MRVYLDNCCFNRPFDDQSQVRIRLETEAKLDVQRRIREGRLELAWSYMLDYENQFNPFEERQEAIGRWRQMALVDTIETPALLAEATRILQRGVRSKDALHAACAFEAGCGWLLTTDDLFCRRMRGFSGIHVMNPTQFVIEVY